MAAAEHPTPPIWERAERHLRVILVMAVVLLLAGMVSMWSIEKSAEPLYKSVPDWSPLGYTYSLALFVFPLIALVLWFRKHRNDHPRHGRAFAITMAVFGVLWCAVDIFLATLFFRFPNAAAHIEPMFWGYEWGVGFTQSIPYEEFAFYFGAISVILLLYLWSREEWYNRYSLPFDEYEQRARTTPPLVSLHWRSVFWGSATLATALLYKKFGPHDHHAGLPGYFMLLWAMAVIPTALLTQRVSPFMNDRALLFTVMAVVLVSLLWEVTLALPNGWWDYRHEHMMGLFMKPWNGLPFEAVLLWPISAWSNVLLFETFRIYVYSDRPFWVLLFGRKPEPLGQP
jgi:hypothetical protein